MSSLLHAEDLASWRLRFESFSDAVIKRWLVAFDRGSPVLESVIEAQDQCSPTGWSFVTIRLSGVSSLRLSEGPKASYQVLSNGLHVVFDAARVGVDFGHSIDTPDSLSVVMTSPCHAVAVALEWESDSVSR
jgi:hypothetical protein